MKQYCVKCDIVIKENKFAKLIGNEDGPAEYKDGWHCSACHQKRQQEMRR